MCADPIEAMEQAISLKIDAYPYLRTEEYLPSGLELLKELEAPGPGRIAIQAGSGVGGSDPPALSLTYISDISVTAVSAAYLRFPHCIRWLHRSHSGFRLSQ